jgi:hypothetical protein
LFLANTGGVLLAFAEVQGESLKALDSIFVEDFRQYLQQAV